MNSQNGETGRAADYLNRTLCRAVEAGADTVEMERVPEGLEICCLAGGSGVGTVLQDRKLEKELIELVVRRAGLQRRSKGKMTWKIQGQDCAITVEEYDSFSKACFRLKLGQSKGKPR